MLDARAAVGNFGEVVFAQFFLFLEAERAVVGGDDLESVFGEALPEFFLIPFFAEGRREDVFRAFKAGCVHIFEREIQVLRAGFGVSGEAAVACFADFFERLVAGEMDDVDGSAGHFGEGDGAGGGFCLGGGGTSERVIFGGAFSFGERLLDDHVDGAAVFRVHADEAIVLRGLAHGLEDGGVIEHENAGIGHEELEAGDAFANELAHFFELRGAEIGDDAVEGVVDERGGASEGCGDGASLEVVGAGGAAKGHVEVRVHVDAAGDDETAGSVDYFARVFGGKLSGDGGDFVSVDTDVGDAGVSSGYDRAVADYGVKTHLRSLGIDFV